MTLRALGATGPVTALVLAALSAILAAGILNLGGWPTASAFASGIAVGEAAAAWMVHGNRNRSDEGKP